MSGGLQVRTPADWRLIPPGQHMLFILDGDGVPSVARLVDLYI